MKMAAEGHSQAHELTRRAGALAAAARRGLPEALVVAFDPEMRIVMAAGRALERLGTPQARAGGMPLSGLFPAALWSTLEPLLISAAAGETRSREIVDPHTGAPLSVEAGPLRAARADGRAGPVMGGVAVLLEQSRLRDMDAAPPPAGNGFEDVFEHAPVGTALLDCEGRWMLVNRALCEITGYTPEELIGRRLRDFLHPDDAAEAERRSQKLLSGELRAAQSELRYLDAAGESMPAIFSMSLVRDARGEALHFIAQLHDISERERREERLRHLIDHDPLTGLRNRRLFDEDLRMQVARSRRYGERAGLVVVDLDAFEAINDGFGHAAGDATLRAVARVITRRLRQTDLVARVGGDEFAALLPHIDTHALAIVAEGLSRVIEACAVDVGEQVLHPRASVGWAAIDERTESHGALLERAGRALHEAKRAARR